VRTAIDFFFIEAPFAGEMSTAKAASSLLRKVSRIQVLNEQQRFRRLNQVTAGLVIQAIIRLSMRARAHCPRAARPRYGVVNDCIDELARSLRKSPVFHFDAPSAA